ncbi:hypothetical protein F5884DRAFT_467734 [Xylogone sp. PMI_703]|nr:hypothetical protein F5884DRAFT_467734 [Xylogone sp. PMI_703]
MQFKSVLAACAFIATTAVNASYINIFGAEDCNDYTSTSDFPGNGQCVNLSPYAQSWEFYLQGNSGCTVHVFANPNCQEELTPAQTKPNQCNDSPVAVKSYSVQCN